MSTINEILKLKRERAEEEKSKAESISLCLRTLRGKPTADLIHLKEHWESEQKKFKRLDDISQRKRLAAGYWIEAINQLLTTKNVPGITSPQNSENMSVTEAAAYLNMSVSTLYKGTAGKTLPHHKVGKKLVFVKTELDDYLKNHRILTDEEMAEQAEQYVGEKQSAKKRR